MEAHPDSKEDTLQKEFEDEASKRVSRARAHARASHASEAARGKPRAPMTFGVELGQMGMNSEL